MGRCFAVGPEFVRQVTLDQEKVFSSRAGWEGMVGEFFEGSLIVQDFEEHRMQRNLMQTAFKAESLRDCYVGLSIIHRSGIFSMADILGPVDGGSDVLAGHIECVR